MSRMQQILAGLAMTLLGTNVSTAQSRTTWHLRDVLRLAAEKVNSEDMSVENARLELQMLEALNRTRFEFRPQLSLLSFSNPIFLATSLGASFSVNKRTAPSPVNMELARFGIVEAELGRARRRINVEVEATRHFFALAAAKEFASRSCQAWTKRSSDREKLQKLISFKRLTNLDLVRFEEDLIGLESDCVEAKSQAQVSASALVRLIGVSAQPEEVEVSTEDLTPVLTSEALPKTTDLIDAAESREDFNLIFDHISALTNSGPKRRFHFESFSTGYSYLKNSMKQSPGLTKEYLLGGNVGHLDSSFYIPLRKTGDSEAEFAFLSGRFNQLKRELKDLKLTVAREVEDSTQQATLAAARLRLAQKKEHLADELHVLTAQRERVGLQPSTDSILAMRDAIRAEAESARVEFDWKRSVYMVLALCDPQKLSSSTLVASQPSSVRPNTVATGRLQDGPSALAQDNDSPIVSNAASNEPSAAHVSFATRNADVTRNAGVTTNAGTTRDTGAGDEREPGGAVVLSPVSLPVHTALPSQREAVAPVSAPLYVAARPVKKVTPDPKLYGARLLRQSLEVDVRVRVDESGHVIAATALDNYGKRNALLAEQAVLAAKEWIFEPAKVRDKTVQCDHTIAFRFVPQSH
jgi:outer membrane biosynthesis protein TonB